MIAQTDPQNAIKIQQYIPPPPPNTITARLLVGIVDWLERRIVKHAKHGNPPVYNPQIFPWVPEVERDWYRVRQELDTVLKRHSELPNFQDITPGVKSIQRDNDWKTFIFYGYGLEYPENLRACPETAALLRKIPGVKTAFFSILSPRKHIPAHRGPYNGVLRLHLGLLVPEPRENCRIRVLDEYVSWEEGKAVVFDDSFDHEVWNDTDGRRVVLFVDFVRPVSWPWSWLNRLALSLAMFTPYIREADANQKHWQQKFYTRR